MRDLVPHSLTIVLEDGGRFKTVNGKEACVTDDTRALAAAKVAFPVSKP